MTILSKEERALLKQLKKPRGTRYRDSETFNSNDQWSGSLDNQERILEEHVSKRGWEF
mgnify:CR=1 FL=1